MIKDNHTKIPDTPRAVAVWKNIWSFSTNPGVISVGLDEVVVVFGELDNADKLANIETKTSESFTETAHVRLLSVLPSLNRRKANLKTPLICEVMKSFLSASNFHRCMLLKIAVLL